MLIPEIMDQMRCHAFVLPELLPYAYLDEQLHIEFGKTISQPFIVGLMIDTLAIIDQSITREIGSGRGYLTAILAELAAQVFSVEIVEELGAQAGENLCHMAATTPNYALAVNRVVGSSIGLSITFL